MAGDERKERTEDGTTGPEADPLVGVLLADRYRVRRRIGSGGMGVVYEAEHEALGKRVAVKVLRSDLGRAPELVERFKLEARNTSAVGHENIVDVSDIGQTPEGDVFFVMELLRGESLVDRLSREVRLPVARAVRVMDQVCRALQAAHDAGVLHRDLKPENVFLVRSGDRDDLVKVLDFGIAKMTEPGPAHPRLTQAGSLMGTPLYMSPEVACGRAADLRADIYAAGVLLFEMLTGRVPFVGESFLSVLHQHAYEPPPAMSEVAPRARVPAAVEAVVRRALEKDPDRRFGSMRELADALRTAAAEPARTTAAEPARTTAAEPLRRTPSASPTGTPRPLPVGDSTRPPAPRTTPLPDVPGGPVLPRLRDTGAMVTPAVGSSAVQAAARRLQEQLRRGTDRDRLTPLETLRRTGLPTRDPDRSHAPPRSGDPTAAGARPATPARVTPPGTPPAAEPDRLGRETPAFPVVPPAPPDRGTPRATPRGGLGNVAALMEQARRSLRSGTTPPGGRTLPPRIAPPDPLARRSAAATLDAEKERGSWLPPEVDTHPAAGRPPDRKDD